MNLYHQNNLWSKNLKWKKTCPIEYLGMFPQSISSSRSLTKVSYKLYLNPGGDWNPGRGSTSQNIHSLKLTAKAPENRPKRPKRKRLYSNHPFSGAKMVVSKRVSMYSHWLWLLPHETRHWAARAMFRPKSPSALAASMAFSSCSLSNTAFNQGGYPTGESSTRQGWRVRGGKGVPLSWLFFLWEEGGGFQSIWILIYANVCNKLQCDQVYLLFDSQLYTCMYMICIYI